MKRLAARLYLLAGLALQGTAFAMQPADFGWQASVELPPSAVAARVALPADVAVASRAGELADVRLLNGQGEPVAFAWRRSPSVAPVPQRTERLPAWPLSREPSPARAGSASIQVRVNAAGGESVWVRMGPGPVDTPPSNLLPAALFDLRRQAGTLQALVLDGELPASLPVRITAATSTDLAQWTPLPLHGSMYRFEGVAGFENRSLALATPQSLQGRYLRLSWDGQAGVRITALAGTLADEAAPARVGAALPPPRDVDGGLEWSIAFPTRITALALATQQANSLVPVRVLGRQQAGQPWRELARTAVFRVGAPGAESINAPVALGAAVRQLRVEAALKGTALPALAAGVDFDAVELVFLATGGGPYQLVAGKADLPAGDVPLATLMAAVPHPDQLQLARLGPPQARPDAIASSAAWLPDVPPATLVLWAVLGLGVLVLATVAWRVLAQLRATAPAATGPVSGSGTSPR